MDCVYGLVTRPVKKVTKALTGTNDFGALRQAA